VATYARTLSAFVGWVLGASADYASIDLRQFDDWQKSLYIERGNSSGYRRRHLNALRSFYGWRASRGYGRDCTDGLRGPGKVTKAPRKYTRSQLRALFAAARKADQPLLAQRDEALLLVLLTTGLRREEAATLRVEQLELGDRTGVVRVEGKGTKERMVPIEGPVVQQLIRWLDARSRLQGLRSDTVFVTVQRSCPGLAMTKQAVERVVKRIAKLAGLGSWGVHRFRVTFATQLYDDGVDLERIRILMGHESIETTRRYVVVSDRMNRVRMKAHRQHDVLGTRPAGFPRWAEQIEKGKGDGPVFPSR
jgi:site-specific recombinase XerD